MTKKLFFLGIILILAVAVFSGCTENELGYYKLNKEMGKIEAYEATQKVSLELKAADELLQSAELKMAAAMLKTVDLEIEYKADNKKMEMEMDITITTPLDKFTLNKMVFKDNIYYLPIEGLKEILQKYGSPQDIAEFNKAVGEAKYITMDFAGDMGLDGFSSFFGEFQPMLEEVILVVDKIINEGYKEYSLGEGIIDKIPQGYKITLKDKDFAPVCLGFASYSLNNSQKIRPGIIDLYKTRYIKEYIELMNMPGISHEELIAGLETLFDQIASEEGKKGALEALDGVKKQLPQFEEIIKGSYFEYSLVKEAGGSYVSATDMLVKLEFSGSNSLRIQDNLRMKPVASVKINAPEGETVSFNQVFPPKTTLTLFLTAAEINEYIAVSGNTFKPEVSFGSTDVIMANDFTYLPLRKIGEIFGENIGWDNTKKVAKATAKDGGEVEFSGIIKNNRVFVKIRDFQSLGYKVDWNSQSKIITLVK